MTAPYSTREDVIARVCGEKTRHRTEQAARAHAHELHAKHPSPIGPYRCPFCHRWHVGHPPSLEALEAIALVIRGLDPVAPVPHDPPAKSRRSRKARRQ